MSTETIAFNFPDDAHRDRAIAVLSRHFGYKPKIDDPNNVGGPTIDNPQSPRDFVAGRIGDLVKGLYAARELLESKQAAEAELNQRLALVTVEAK